MSGGPRSFAKAAKFLVVDQPDHLDNFKIKMKMKNANVLLMVGLPNHPAKIPLIF